MSEIYRIGPCPANEEPAQSTDPDFHQKNKAECLAFITAIKRICGEPPEGARLTIETVVGGVRPYQSGAFASTTVNPLVSPSRCATSGRAPPPDRPLPLPPYPA